MQTGFIAAIDLGTSKITGVIGRKNENNVISVMAYETVPSNNCVRRGAIHNVEEAGSKVRKLIDFLEKKIGKRIGRVYVSLAGQSLFCIDVREMRQLPQSGIITDEIVKQLSVAADKYKPDLKRKYAIADVEYFCDDKPERNPVGVTCSLLEADYKVIIGRPNLYTNIQKTIVEKSQLQIADLIVGPLATAAIALNDEEKELGCALIDFGAGTTTLSIYKGDILRYLVVIPFGGKTITKDISELNFTETDSEQYKIKFGKAKEGQETSFFSSPFSSKPDINMEELNKVIVMRLDEITANIKEQIKQSGYKGQLGAGIIITGGASQLKNLDLYLEGKLEMKVRKATAKKTIINNSPELTNDPAYTQVLGMFLLADEDCEQIYVQSYQDEKIETKKSISDFTKKQKKSFSEMKQMVNKKNKEKDKRREEKPKGPSIGERMGNIFGGLFSEDDDE